MHLGIECRGFRSSLSFDVERSVRMETAVNSNQLKWGLLFVPVEKRNVTHQPRLWI
ncbi:hypothetical protein RE6C_03824 [Rhodopirellula europaea 6C]|uniref:Uncharacterized protein n=1 Tax=Rhodopirellula europaea 6C TaxID=1263867 RepID=M2AEB8_9BACT|nr:hypothetical protein RE6C_03824 [Rhodopirellula europaea 6C]